jgi:hypothetical protein
MTRLHGFFFRLLKSSFGLDFDVDKAEREQSIRIRWDRLREASYTEMDKWLKTGEPRPVALRCKRAIEDLLAKGEPSNRIFIMARAVATDGLSYDFSSASKANASVSVDLLEQVKTKARGGLEIKNSTILEIKQPLFIGYAPPLQLQKWAPTGLSSPGIVSVFGASTSLTIAD